jgi:Na+-translocating ferredoxin:NAD+ oxidoreductase RnfE subunit
MQTTVSLSLSHCVTLPVTSLMQAAVSLSLSHRVTLPVTSLMQTTVSLSLSHRVTLPVFNCQFSLKTLYIQTKLYSIITLGYWPRLKGK